MSARAMREVAVGGHAAVDPAVDGRRSGSPSTPSAATMRRHCSTVNVSQNGGAHREVDDRLADGDVGHGLDQPAEQQLPAPPLRGCPRPATRVDDLDHRPVLAAQHPLERRAVGRAAARGRCELAVRLRLDGDRRPRWPREMERPFDPDGRRDAIRRPLDGGAARDRRAGAGMRSGRHRRLGCRRPRSTTRRSPGPPRAGSAGLVTKASWDSVSDRRGTASRVTVTRISRRGSRLPRTTRSAAPVAAPRRRPRARKASSLAVTRGSRSSVSSASRGAVAGPERSCAPRARQLGAAAPSARSGERPPSARGCSVARGADGRLTAPAVTRVAGSCRSTVRTDAQRFSRALTLDVRQEFLVQPVDASWLQCNIECQEACPVGTNCRGYLNLAAEGRFEEGYILSREPNPVAAMCSYVCSAPCERACRRGDIDRPLAIRAMKRFLVEWHEASGIPDVMPHIEARAEKVAVVGAGPGRHLRRARAGDEGLRRRRLRQPAVRRRDDAHRRARVPPPARGDRDGHPPRRAARGDVPLQHQHRRRHRLRRPPARLRRGRDHRRRDERGRARRARARTSRASSTASTS